MTLKELYEELNADYAQASRRLLNENLMKRFVLKFLTDPCMNEVRSSLEAGDPDTSFRAAHTMKGVAGNLGFTRLYHAAWNLTEHLRPRQAKSEVNMDLLRELEEEYKHTHELIEKFAQQQE